MNIREGKITIHSTAIVADDVQLEDNVKIGPYCVIESGAAIQTALS